MTWGPDVETNLAISSANHLKVRFIQQSLAELKQIMLDSYYGNNFTEEKNIFLKTEEKSHLVKEST
ncbi:hypothetical protein E3U36_10775 [Arsenophonus endosymbiont of Aphis craccivora]|uniref:hypothetical protein n=1 Tax=Arsenophonus endosymbiont of Aphis craccivora TaxID=1231049 RepID=UPI0015DCC674|nr:hypothetical protein [Arsenophonus endosymbiont of Aphis craccivora]QLK88406.1 hypothetical protein E3U36_10775 [Arsenophonus endosymbiont of Aphis craccivora]